MHDTEEKKTRCDREMEEQLMQELVTTVGQRSDVVDRIEEDRIRLANEVASFLWWVTAS